MIDIEVNVEDLKHRIKTYQESSNPIQEMSENYEVFNSRESMFHSTIEDILDIINQTQYEIMGSSSVVALETFTVNSAYEYIKGNKYMVTDQNKHYVTIQDENGSNYSFSCDETKEYFISYDDSQSNLKESV